MPRREIPSVPSAPTHASCRAGRDAAYFMCCHRPPCCRCRHAPRGFSGCKLFPSSFRQAKLKFIPLPNPSHNPKNWLFQETSSRSNSHTNWVGGLVWGCGSHPPFLPHHRKFWITSSRLSSRAWWTLYKLGAQDSNRVPSIYQMGFPYMHGTSQRGLLKYMATFRVSMHAVGMFDPMAILEWTLSLGCLVAEWLCFSALC